MSAFSMPDEFGLDPKRIEEQFQSMNEAYMAMMPKQFAGPFNLMAHPMAATAAASALGLGMASHAAGLWMGTMAGAAESAQRMWGLPATTPEAPAYKPESPASEKTRAAVDTLVEEARSTAREIADVTARTATGPVDDVQKVAKAVQKSADAARPEAPAEIMPEDFRKPRVVGKPKTPDDLKLISGIGPKLEQVLNGLGVWTYQQIAAWTAEEIAWVDDYLSFKGRIGRDGWIEQAAALAIGKTKV